MSGHVKSSTNGARTQDPSNGNGKGSSFRSLREELIPYEVEGALMGAGLLNPDLFVTLPFDPDDFNTLRYGQIWRIGQRLVVSGIYPDSVILQEELQKQSITVNLAEFARLSNDCPNCENALEYARIVHDYADRRRAALAHQDAGRAIADPKSDWRASVAHLGALASGNGKVAEAEAEELLTPDGLPLPQIIITNRPMPAVTDEAIDALQTANNPPALFVRSGSLARVRTDERGRPVIDDVDGPVLRGHMARAAQWYKVNATGEMRHVPPPDDVVKDTLALGRWPFPALDGITETPALRDDGTTLDRPGYDQATGLFYVPAAGLEPPTVPSHPSPAELAAAVALLGECIGDFPYADDASRANAFALLLTPVLRPAIRGNTPLALIDKPQAGTGASLLAEAVSILATGRQAAMMTAPADDGEWRKRITAALLEGATVITIDNVEAILQSASLAAALTSSTWKDRVLGQSATVVLSQRATWLATGNNIRLGGDMPRRCYWIRLDAQTAQPWRRQDFKHPGLIGWITENRGQLLGAMLTIARAWYAAGCPRAAATSPLGSFEDWARTMGGVLAFAKIPGFLGNLDALYERVDEEGQQWQRFLETWAEVYGETKVTVAELMKRLKAGHKQEQMALDLAENGQAEAPKDPGAEALAEALPDYLADGLTDPKRAGGFSRQLGKALAKRADMTFDGGVRLKKLSDQHTKTQQWHVTKTG